jgi:hypothetical protein
LLISLGQISTACAYSAQAGSLWTLTKVHRLQAVLADIHCSIQWQPTPNPPF